MSQRLAGVLLILLCAGLSSASAAPPVTRVTRVPQVSHYDAAARAAGDVTWGATLQNKDRIHVLVWPRLRDQRYAILLPTTLPADRADPWFAALSDTLGWKKAEISSATHANGLILYAIVRDPVPATGLGRFRLQVPRDLIARELRQLTPLPVHLAIRIGAPQFTASSQPVSHQTKIGQQHFLFYSPEAKATALPAPIAVTYGVTDRWYAALAALLACWAILPTLVLLTVRELLRRDPHQSPKQRHERYQRWLKPVILVTISGAVTTPLLISLPQSAFALTSMPQVPFVGGLLSAVLIPLSWVVVPATFIGARLVQEASDKPEQPVWRAAVTAGVLLHVIPLVSLWIGIPIAWLTRLISLVGVKTIAIIACLAIPVWMLATKWLAQRHWRHREAGLLDDDEPAPAIVAERAAAVGAKVNAPVTQVWLSDLTDTTRGVMANGSIAVLHRPLLEKLTTEQLAGLIAAEALAEQIPGRLRWLSMMGRCFVLGTMLTGLWILLGAKASTSPLSPTPTQSLILLLCVPSSLVCFLICGTQLQRHKEDADLRVADALSSPDVLLEAFQLQESGRIQALKPGSEPPADASERRIALLRRLGRGLD